ncbi:MAG: D-alanyl-D-alanine carboxypeptidase/D-alanyl-D-alanine endopeptidase [Actinomycetes bacterium]
MGTADGHPRPASRRRGLRAAAAATVVLLLAAAVVASLDLSGRLPGGLVADPTSASASPATPLDPRPAGAPDVLVAEPTGPSGAAPTLPTDALDRVLASTVLGPERGALVVDVASGATLLDVAGTVPRTPASLAKLATGAAALTVLDPVGRLRTRVVAGAAPGEVVLVGAGDTTLTSRRSLQRRDPVRASLAGLADATAAALVADGTNSVTLRVDDSLFAGPAVSPDWRAGYVGSGVVSPVGALSVDAGRIRPASDVREPDPALAAGRDMARMLARRGVTVSGDVARGVAPAGARELSSVSSGTVAELVELMLTSSDNDLAESLLRLVAVQRGRPGTFADGTAAVTGVLTELGVPTDGMVLLDGSGLARGSSVAPATLAGLLVLASDGSTPRLGHLVTGLPVAGFSGTLSQRFAADRAGDAAGLVRAKTGTLTGVSTLAGVTSVAGRPVVFVVMADQVPGSTLVARSALDRFAATLAGAGQLVAAGRG